MYCFTYVNGLTCVLNELSLWSDISSEHPIFIKTVAELTKKELSEEVLAKLMEVNKRFTLLKKSSSEIKMQASYTPYNQHSHLLQVKKLVMEFIKYDRYVFSVLDEVKQYGKEDKVWQTLLEHITEEQEFMYELFTNMNMQLII